jgi:uncharacterized protein DUF3365
MNTHVAYLCCALLAGLCINVSAAEPAAPAKLTIPQARREVRLLDDVYKTSIVLINNTYVTDAASTPAASVAREIFAAMKKNGWHEARLIDGTGKPINPENAPANEFEKQAMAKILKGEKYVDAVVDEGGSRYLRAATVVPVVNAKCIICHPGNKVGDVLGAISYKLPVE